jgi:hypothetical protein
MVVFPEEGKINSEEAVLIIERSQGGSSPRHHQKKKICIESGNAAARRLHVGEAKGCLCISRWE